MISKYQISEIPDLFCKMDSYLNGVQDGIRCLMNEQSPYTLTYYEKMIGLEHEVNTLRCEATKVLKKIRQELNVSAEAMGELSVNTLPDQYAKLMVYHNRDRSKDDYLNRQIEGIYHKAKRINQALYNLWVNIGRHVENCPIDEPIPDYSQTYRGFQAPTQYVGPRIRSGNMIPQGPFALL